MVRWFSRAHYDQDVAQHTAIQRLYLQRLGRVIALCVFLMVFIVGCVLYQIIWMHTWDGLAGCALSVVSILYLLHFYLMMRKRVKDWPK